MVSSIVSGVEEIAVRWVAWLGCEVGEMEGSRVVTRTRVWEELFGYVVNRGTMVAFSVYSNIGREEGCICVSWYCCWFFSFVETMGRMRGDVWNCVCYCVAQKYEWIWNIGNRVRWSWIWKL